MFLILQHQLKEKYISKVIYCDVTRLTKVHDVLNLLVPSSQMTFVETETLMVQLPPEVKK